MTQAGGMRVGLGFQRAGVDSGKPHGLDTPREQARHQATVDEARQDRRSHIENSLIRHTKTILKAAIQLEVIAPAIDVLAPAVDQHNGTTQ